MPSAAEQPGRDVGVITSRSPIAQEPMPAATVQPASNRSPVLSGAPPVTIVAGSPYAFQPVASDPDNDALTFSISGLPEWASFDTSTGRLSGTPSSSQTGLYGSILISVSDGRDSATLPAFGIDVAEAPASDGSGTVTLSWTPPTQNVDGTPLTTLAGYRIYFGTSASELTQTVQITNPGLTTYVMENLAPGTQYFAIASIRADGVESERTAVASTTIL